MTLANRISLFQIAISCRMALLLSALEVRIFPIMKSVKRAIILKHSFKKDEISLCSNCFPGSLLEIVVKSSKILTITVPESSLKSC